MTEDTLGSRIRTARKRAKLSLEAVGRHFDISGQAVQQWEKDKTSPDPNTIVGLADLTHVNLVWLLTGRVVSRLDASGGEFGSLPAGGRTVAKLSLKQAVRKQIDYSSGTAVHAHFPCSKRAFAIDVFDRRNAPEYDIGDRVVIDPDRLPTPGNMVFAVVGKDHDPIFGRYARRAGRTTVAEIKALNSDWEAVLLTDATTDRIIGTMTEHVRPGR